MPNVFNPQIPDFAGSCESMFSKGLAIAELGQSETPPGGHVHSLHPTTTMHLTNDIRLFVASVSGDGFALKQIGQGKIRDAQFE